MFKLLFHYHNISPFSNIFIKNIYILLRVSDDYIKIYKMYTNRVVCQDVTLGKEISTSLSYIYIKNLCTTKTVQYES